MQAFLFVGAIMNVVADLEEEKDLLFRGAAYAQHYIKPKGATA